jgi:hypothetical protein
VINVLLALYPAPWRRRYGEEFRAVLESRPLGPFDVADVVLGALDARLAFRFAETSSALGGHITMLRLGGYGAIGGGTLWALGLAIGSATEDTRTWLPVAMLGTIGLLLALAGLSAFQAHREPRLAWAAFATPALGAVVSIVGLAGMLVKQDEPFVGSWSGWGVWAVGMLAMVIGSALFAVATIRAAVLSVRAAIALLISSLAFIVVGLGLGVVWNVGVGPLVAAAGSSPSAAAGSGSA